MKAKCMIHTTQTTAISYISKSVQHVVKQVSDDSGPNMQEWLMHKKGREIIIVQSHGGMVVIVLLDKNGNPLAMDSYPG